MKTKFLTGYKMIKPTKKYKIGLKRAYNQLVKYQNKLIEKGKLIESRRIIDFETFKESYISKAFGGKQLTKNQISKIRVTKSYISYRKQSLRYFSSLKGARSLKEQIKQLNIDIVERAREEGVSEKEIKDLLIQDKKSLAELRGMTTTEIAELYSDEIKATYAELKDKYGKGNSAKAAEELAEMYFGS